MPKFVIQGSTKLEGKVRIAGFKNAITPILAATLLTDQTCRIENVPAISDVRRMLDLLKDLGAQIKQPDEHIVEVTCKDVAVEKLNRKAVKQMRSSILLLGPLLARFLRVDQFPEPGGCIIGNRPLDTHFAALRGIGAELEVDEGRGSYSLKAKKLKGGVIVLPEFSVTATENILMAAAVAEGETVIRGAAVEPHVQDLISFLKAMGADISFTDQHEVRLRGVKKLHGATHRIIPDQLEIGTFAVAAAVTKGDIEMSEVLPKHLDAILLKLKQTGASVVLKNNTLRVSSNGTLNAFRLQAMPYPGFPTDLQAPFGLMATQSKGTSLIHDPMFEGRMGYVGELVKMGANAVVCDPHRVLVTGPTPLYGTEIRSLDLRAGITLILAGLAAEGETVIHDAEIVERGYERFDERLRALGAEITKID